MNGQIRQLLFARRLATLGVLLASLLPTTPAAAHEDTPAVLALKETARGRFAVHFAPAVNGGRPDVSARPVFPAHCSQLREFNVGNALATDGVIECGPQGLGGTLRFESNRPLKVSVNVEPLGAPAWSRLAQGDPPTLELGPLETTGRRNLFSDYLQLGTHHILSGLDHLAFIAGLLLLASGLRMLLLTITAFTLAHSVTLALQTLGVTRAPVSAVELCIALSVLLLAVEASHKQQPTWTRQAPWLAAFSFGLLHGLGFASALSAVGIPGQHVALCLLAFNAGVEVGQLLVVLGLLALWRLLLRTPIRRTSEAQSRAQSMATLCLGGASAYWVLGRGQAWLTQLWSG